MNRDINGYNGFGLKMSDVIYSTTLASGVAQSLTIPISSIDSPRYLAIFTCEPGGVFAWARNNTAVLPGGSFALTTSEGNPIAREVKAGDVLSFITSDTTLMLWVSLYELSTPA
jgi:hypothetical protein